MWAPFAAPSVSQSSPYGGTTSSVPSSLPSSRNCTPSTPTLSLALAVMVMTSSTVAPSPGAVMATLGGVGSAGSGLLSKAIGTASEPKIFE